MEYKNSNKKVAFCSLGCKVNQYETNAMAQKFVANGYEIVEFVLIFYLLYWLLCKY